jgi:formylglycine-generating enzyme required for sulfatase activity
LHEQVFSWLGEKGAIAALPGAANTDLRELTPIGLAWHSDKQLVGDTTATMPSVSAELPRGQPAEPAHHAATPAPLNLTGLPKGTLLKGRLVVRDRLGAGGMAVVYLVWDRTLDELRALKIMNVRGEDSRGWRERFLKEARGTLRVQHRNVVRAFALHDDLLPANGEVLALELEYVPNGSLQDARRRILETPLAQRLELLAAVADGLTAIHDAGLVHRDIKPANVLLDGADKPKVSDLGLARPPTNGEETEHYHTPAYAAPEQRLGADLDAQTDLYAFGVMAYELLSGTLPEGHAYMPAPKLNVTGLAEDVVRLVEECLEKRPKNRPRSAAEVARRLRAGIERQPLPAAVLGLDIVGYSREQTALQGSLVSRLNQAILSCAAVRAVAPERLLRLPSGDGAFLVFFEDAGAAWDTALELALKLEGKVRTRIGLHFGNVLPVADLNDQLNAAGGGINMCQRVMAFGDLLHVLASDAFREQLLHERPGEVAAFLGPLQGMAKHDVALTVWNVVTDGVGRSDTPAKLASFEGSRHHAPPGRKPIQGAGVTLPIEPEAKRAAREEQARLAKAEAERAAREEQARLAKAEAERTAREEQARLAKAEAERTARDEQARLAKVEALVRPKDGDSSRREAHVASIEDAWARTKDTRDAVRTALSLAGARGAAPHNLLRLAAEDLNKAEVPVPPDEVWSRGHFWTQQRVSEIRDITTPTPAPPPPAPPPASSGTGRFRWYLSVAVIAVLLVAVAGFVIKTKEQTSTPASDAPSLAPQVHDSAGMVRIAGGTFQMGASDISIAEPVTTVTLSGYSMDRTEVTVAAYRACVLAGQCSAEKLDSCAPWGNWGVADKEQHPINCVDWGQAKAYCEAQGKRLPTEAEWEFGARGKDSWKYPWGDQAPDASLAKWNSQDGTAPVGTHTAGASPFGLQDMAGNVWEWVEDAYGAYPGGTATNPTQGSGQYRVSRGGSWGVKDAAGLRGAVRFQRPPGLRADFLGFRCASGAVP